ncbi:nuclear transport factor 2 family protein [Metamycoplasma equirhinis]|uniref:nuclear transport factor 2 family protein n=1 Tax=Metamycoplasma equirhinis TaxID=92402 RepID=UPI003593DC6F
MNQNNPIEVFNNYANALAQGNFAAAFETMSDDIIWHMGGSGPLSGKIVGKQSLGKSLAEFAKRSNGTFKVVTNWIASNGNFVAASVVSLANKDQAQLNNPGIDLFKIENGKILEVWTFSEFQAQEDEFWKN